MTPEQFNALSRYIEVACGIIGPPVGTKSRKARVGDARDHARTLLVTEPEAPAEVLCDYIDVQTREYAERRRHSTLLVTEPEAPAKVKAAPPDEETLAE